MKTMLLTGGIGSGKSFIAKMVEQMGIPVYYSDSRVKELYVSSYGLRSRVMELLGTASYNADGLLNTGHIAALLFSDESLRGRLEEMVYPVLLDDIVAWKSRKKEEGRRVAVIESAVMLEKPMFRDVVDSVISVNSPTDVRCRRAAIRDNVSPEEIKKRIACQWSDEERNRRADYIIISDDSTPILPQLNSIIQQVQ